MDKGTGHPSNSTRDYLSLTQHNEAASLYYYLLLLADTRIQLAQDLPLLGKHLGQTIWGRGIPVGSWMLAGTMASAKSPQVG